jgi:hypothetical protein
MNLKVYVDVEADRRLIRRIDRDMVERGRSFASIVHQVCCAPPEFSPLEAACVLAARRLVHEKV